MQFIIKLIQSTGAISRDLESPIYDELAGYEREEEGDEEANSNNSSSDDDEEPKKRVEVEEVQRVEQSQPDREAELLNRQASQLDEQRRAILAQSAAIASARGRVALPPIRNSNHAAQSLHFNSFQPRQPRPLPPLPRQPHPLPPLPTQNTKSAKMPGPNVPKPGPAKLTKGAGLPEWLAEAKQCHYLPEDVMKQLCELVKEHLMEGKSPSSSFSSPH